MPDPGPARGTAAPHVVARQKVAIRRVQVQQAVHLSSESRRTTMSRFAAGRDATTLCNRLGTAHELWAMRITRNQQKNSSQHRQLSNLSAHRRRHPSLATFPRRSPNWPYPGTCGLVRPPANPPPTTGKRTSCNPCPCPCGAVRGVAPPQFKHCAAPELMADSINLRHVQLCYR
jgi:hypothetical protein